MNPRGKRFTISVSPSMETDLNRVKQEHYGQETHSRMINDLIMRGLTALKEQKETEDGRSA